eukprot:TRINITY_DN6638_c0_g1_i3.p2 TRINITY_DN6638_c0_g1~~TRINITY_DN6638_c0_g1_i3.p2  ORF type:complete len:241 (-),score=61.68 TRINITY_DN6638_c0_g1_i3:24-746(-)
MYRLILPLVVLLLGGTRLTLAQDLGPPAPCVAELCSYGCCISPTQCNGDENCYRYNGDYCAADADCPEECCIDMTCRPEGECSKNTTLIIVIIVVCILAVLAIGFLVYCLIQRDRIKKRQEIINRFIAPTIAKSLAVVLEGQTGKKPPPNFRNRFTIQYFEKLKKENWDKIKANDNVDASSKVMDLFKPSQALEMTPTPAAANNEMQAYEYNSPGDDAFKNNGNNYNNNNDENNRFTQIF